MSFVENFKREFIEKIWFYSQEEGYKDGEIADILGCSRATVNRTRHTYNIPTANLRNRMDKECVCDECGKEYMIRRKERRKRVCAECLETE